MMLTLHSHYLRSNQLPSEDETREIKALKANPLKEFSTIDVEIEKIEGILNSLKRKRAHIQESIDDFNIILAPVRRLSRDVLGMIFGHCLATHRNPIMSASEAPILLTHICRNWRSIALSTPQLWSRLYIPIMPVVPIDCSEVIRYAIERDRRMEVRTKEVRRWLRLSAACPLAITLMPAVDPVPHPPLLDAIIETSRRWQQLELGFLSPKSDIMSRLISLSPDDLCMLRELRIRSLDSMIDLHTQDLRCNSGLLTAQGLRSISITDAYHIYGFLTRLPPNWKNLNRLFINSPISLGVAHSILIYCCKLVTCLLHVQVTQAYRNGIGVIPDAPLTPSSCILPRLTFLSLRGDRISCSQLFSSIRAPSLQILDLRENYPSEFEDSSFLNFLQNINCLETLRVDHALLTESNVLKYYTLVPSVTHLVLGRSRKQLETYGSGKFSSSFAYPELKQVASSFITTPQEFSHQYSPDSAPTPLFPSLEILEAYDISGVTDTTFLEFIKARVDATKSNAVVSKLKKVLVEFSRKRQTDIVPEALAYAQAAGIDLKLDLTYNFTRNSKLDRVWSPSYGLSNDVSWTYHMYD